MSAMIFLFHLLALAVNGFAAFYQYFIIEIGHNGFLGKFRFLTFWNICFLTVYFGLCVVNDVVSWSKPTMNPSQRGTLQRWRDTFYACVAYPTTVFVFLSFWILIAIDRELVFPKALDALFPSWLNHLLHTTIFPFILIEKVIVYHHYPRRVKGIMGTGLLAFAYLLIVLLVAYVDNYWVYPILQVLGMFQRTLFISVCTGIFALFYLSGEILTSRIWGSGLKYGIGRESKASKSFKGV